MSREGTTSRQEPAAGHVSQVVEHLFRHESGRMVALLTGIFGSEHLTLAEDVVQEALVRAMQTWPFYGVPENPAAWIMRAARNLALDVVRREKVFREKEDEIIHSMKIRDSRAEKPVPDEQEIGDDRLRMMFLCCHPLLPEESHVVLALRTLCGFSVSEISRAFLTTEAAIAKRLTRAKQQIREARIPFEMPEGEELAGRLDGVLHTLYLLFNEGYKASGGERLVRGDICEEAIRLTGLLVEHPVGNRSETHALLAVMLLNAARIPARVDDDGNLLLLREQDRTLWDKPMMARGMGHLAGSAGGGTISRYHLQAGIAACHCTAKDYDSTDWRKILTLYDHLMESDGSPVIALNRAVAVAELHGPQAGLNELRAIRNREKLEAYHLFHSVMGEFEMRLNRPKAAAEHFRKSWQLAETKSENQFLQKRLEACKNSGEGGQSGDRAGAKPAGTSLRPDGLSRVVT